MPDDNFNWGRYGEKRRGPSEPVGKLFDRLPPHSPEAEMSLLGSLLLDHQVMPGVLGIISGRQDFYAQAHAEIYQSLLDLYDKRNAGDLVQLLDALRDRGSLDSVGGAEYLVKLANSVPSSVNAPHYASIVADKARLRRLIDVSGQILYDCYHVGDFGPDGGHEVVDRAEMMVFEVAKEQERSDPQQLAELLQIEIQRIEDQEGKGISGVATHYPDLDQKLRGLQPGEMIVVAARPSMGKTALALNLAEQVAMGRGPGGPASKPTSVGFFSLEMSKSAVVLRLISSRSGISAHDLRSGRKIDREDWARVEQGCAELRETPLFIDDTPSLTIMSLRARARRMVAQHGVGAIFVDYLQLLTAPGSSRESRQVEVSAISRGIKALARELNVPIVCLSQLNRASEQREGNRPRMSDLRESGSIEQDADVIVLLHREEYYHIQDKDWAMENPDRVGVAELIIAKQRNGPTGVVELMWDARTTRFKNLDHHAHADDPYGPPPARQPQASGFEVKPPARTPSRGFPAGGTSGPIPDFRDGGGPEPDDEAPF